MAVVVLGQKSRLGPLGPVSVLLLNATVQGGLGEEEGVGDNCFFVCVQGCVCDMPSGSSKALSKFLLGQAPKFCHCCPRHKAISLHALPGKPLLINMA